MLKFSGGTSELSWLDTQFGWLPGSLPQLGVSMTLVGIGDFSRIVKFSNGRYHGSVGGLPVGFSRPVCAVQDLSS